MKILVTGAAGFIGFHVARRLLANGLEVIGADNLNTYYDVSLKQARLRQLTCYPNFRFHRLDLADASATESLFASECPARVVHLAAQAGVRYSLTNPGAYVQSNLVGFANVLECCRSAEIEHLLYASSSSVYGSNTKQPYSVEDNVDHPISFYAATKKSNELMAHVYSHLFSLPTTGLRFFTVYGPWGRPDMAPFLFAKAIVENRPIHVYNHGQMKRDFTYVEDVAQIVERLVTHVPACHPPYKVYNVGNNAPVNLLDFIATLEQCFGKEANKVLLAMQPGDVQETYADVAALQADIGFTPSTPLDRGLASFVDWYKSFYLDRASEGGEPLLSRAADLAGNCVPA
jgi:UDP-glucuronate 4-epimerase